MPVPIIIGIIARQVAVSAGRFLIKRAAKRLAAQQAKRAAAKAAKKNAKQALKKGDKLKKRKKKENCKDCTRSENHPEGAKPGRPTKGKTKQFEKSGGKTQLDKDFDSYNPAQITTKPTPKGNVTTGKLSDGRIITKRNFSSDGRPTLEIRNPANGRGAETRYNP